MLVCKLATVRFMVLLLFKLINSCEFLPNRIILIKITYLLGKNKDDISIMFFKSKWLPFLHKIARC